MAIAQSNARAACADYWLARVIEVSLADTSREPCRLRTYRANDVLMPFKRTT